MSRTLRTAAVTVELGTGTWSASWPSTGVRAGPFTAAALVGDRVLATDVDGAWSITTGDGFGRAGAWARWTPNGDGPMLALHVPTDGEAVVVELVYRATGGDERLDRLVPVAGPVDLGAPLTNATRLVNGYDSWSYAGVRAAEDPGLSWWGTALVRADQEAALAVQALDASRFATAITSRSQGEGLRVEVACGATPPVEPVDGSWGYEVLPPPRLALPVPEGGEERSPPIAVASSRDPFGVVESLTALAGEASDARRWDGPPVTGWQSWYHYGILLIDAKQFLANARLMRARFGDRHGFDLAQLDDGWQVTYGAWWPNERFPDDMGQLVAEVRALGCRPGLWLAPFMVQPGAPGLATEHPEWMIRGAGGPVADRYGRWSLDASNPDACEWLRDLGSRVRAWGFEMVKLDFLYLGALEGVRYDARVTGTEALRRGLRAVVDGLGDDVYLLACGAPLLPVVGLCHGNRVGHDLAVSVELREFGQPLSVGWTGFHGVRPQARNVAARWALHRRWFDCDPDVVMAWGSRLPRDEGGYSLDESRTLATMAAFCGGPFFLADDLAALTEDERAVLEDPGVLDLAWGEGFRPTDLFDRCDTPASEHFFDQPHTVPSVWVAERGGHHVEARFNWTDEPAGGMAAHTVRVTRLS